VHPLGCRLVIVRYLVGSYYFEILGRGQMTPTWKIFENPCLKPSDRESRVVAKFSENWPLLSWQYIVSFGGQKTSCKDSSEPPFCPQLSGSRPKVSERGRPLTCVRVPNLVRMQNNMPITWYGWNMNRKKNSKKWRTFVFSKPEVVIFQPRIELSRRNLVCW